MPSSPPENLGIARRRWRISLLLAFGIFVNFLDRVNVSVAKDALHGSFGISLVGFGYILSAYSWTYALMQIPSGIFLDRWGVRRVGRVSAFIWSAASFAAAIATSVGSFVAARFMLGIGESPIFPANAKALGYWFPDSERSLATAITDAAAKVSAALGIPFVGFLLIHFGWRWSFAVTGFVSLAYFFLFYAVYRNPSEDRGLSAAEHAWILENGAQPEVRIRSASGRSGASFDYLLDQKKVWGLAIGWSAYNYCFYLLLAWMPAYLSVAHHVNLLDSALFTSIPWIFAALTDFFIGGLLVDALIRRGFDSSRVRQTVILVGTSFGLGILGAAFSHSTLAAVFWISVSLGGLAAAAPVAWTVPSLIAPRESVGTLGGIANCCGQVAAICAPIVTGYLAASKGSFPAAFAAATAFLLLGIAAYAFLLGRIEPITEPSAVFPSPSP